MSFSKQKLTIIDTKCANIASVLFAFKRLGIDAKVSADIADIKSADKLILPGVGTAKAAMQNMSKEMIDCIQNAKQTTLGICLGMQLMASFSDEGQVNLLNLFDAKVEHFKDCNLPLPHMGWNQISFDPNHPLFKGLAQNANFYFVHSYRITENPNTIARCEYGEKFSAVMAKDNFLGAQFHPEKSGKNGEILLRNFLEM